MKKPKQKQVVPESKLKEVTGGGQIKDDDVSRPTPVDDAGGLAAPVEFCSVCNAPLIGKNKECKMCKIKKTQPSLGIQSNSQNPPLVDVPPYKVRG